MPPLTEEQVRKIAKEEIRKATRMVYQGDIVPKAVKQGHIDGKIIFTGTTASRPDGSTEVNSYFSTDDNILAIWDGSEWVEFARIPASLTTYTQTYSTADATHANPTATAVGDLVATSGGWGYSTEANADKVHTAIDALIVDLADVKQLVNQVIDDLQSIGLVS
jgi:hypothetical protein